MININQHSESIICELLLNHRFSHCEYNLICELDLQSLNSLQFSQQFHMLTIRIWMQSFWNGTEVVI